MTQKDILINIENDTIRKEVPNFWIFQFSNSCFKSDSSQLNKMITKATVNELITVNVVIFAGIKHSRFGMNLT